MRKSVIASLKPYFYYLVGEGIKKIEVRKDMPKASDWNRETYFYMSKDEKSFAKIPKEYQDKYRKHFGKVGLKFVCDRIDEYILTLDNGDNYSTRDFMYYPLKDACLSQDEIVDYGKGKTLYGWHISDLKIYDWPKELSKFWGQTKCSIAHTRECWVCFAPCKEINGKIYQPMKKAPQSWCYCEELEK